MLRHAKITQDRIVYFNRRLYALIYAEKVPLRLEMAGPVGRISHAEAQQLEFKPATLGTSLGPVWSTFWFRLRGTVPEAWAGRRIDLSWNSHTEATLWRDGRPVQGLNYAPGGALSHAARPNAKLWQEAPAGAQVDLEIEVACNQFFDHHFSVWDTPDYKFPSAMAMEGVSNGLLEEASLALFDPEAWDFCWDYWVLADLVRRADPNALTPWEGHLLGTLNTFLNIVEVDDRSTWPAGRDLLRGLHENRNATWQHEVSAIGHAHIDTAWLWPLAETRRKCVRTFSTAIAYLKDYPEYKFTCSQAQQYQWIKEAHPELYREIGEAIQRGQWIPAGGTWIEPDCNIPSGESLVRQFLVGKRFFRQEFGWDCQEFWNPDVFGYTGALPQIMRGVGIDFFLTQKLSWNQLNKPPHHTFEWEGIDGSRVLTHFPPADSYNAMAANFPLGDLLFSGRNYKDHDRGNQSMFLFGYGDGGGGPTRDMLEVLRRVKDLQGVPRTEQRSVAEFVTRLRAHTTDVPVVSGELYFELHRGTYTTEADAKRDNRRCEFLLREIELLGATAHTLDRATYPTAGLDALWKIVLLNQFHDIIPGSSIREVYEEAARDYALVLRQGEELLAAAWQQLSPGEQPTAFNSCGWKRRALIETEGIEAGVAPQISHNGKPLLLVDLPAMGTSPAEPMGVPAGASAQERDGLFALENEGLCAIFSPAGLLVSLYDKKAKREAINAATPANRFVLFDDHPNRFDAWDMEVFHLETRRELPGAPGIRIIEEGPLRAALEWEFGFGSSRIKQRVYLEAHAGHLEFETEIDWHERQKFLKVEFPVTVRAPEATYEIQFGSVRRPTHFNTSYDIARFEGCGHKWIDLSEPDYGVALFTDSKYGYAVHGSVMRISLLRSTTFPDPEADQGTHHFRYACYPHAGGLIDGEVVRRAFEFNCPAWVRPGSGRRESWFSVDTPHLVLDTVKKAEDSDALIVRLYEAHGASGQAILKTSLPFVQAHRVNLLEEKGEPLTIHRGPDSIEIPLSFRGFEIISLELKATS